MTEELIWCTCSLCKRHPAGRQQQARRTYLNHARADARRQNTLESTSDQPPQPSQEQLQQGDPFSCSPECFSPPLYFPDSDDSDDNVGSHTSDSRTFSPEPEDERVAFHLGYDDQYDWNNATSSSSESDDSNSHGSLEDLADDPLFFHHDHIFDPYCLEPRVDQELNIDERPDTPPPYDYKLGGLVFKPGLNPQY